LDEAKRDGLKRKQQALLLASYDMVQAAAAARSLEGEADGDLARALETAMAVCYMRAFTKGAARLPGRFTPRDAPDADFHKQLVELRHRVYAHTDKASGRRATMNLEAHTGGVWTYAYREEWVPVDRRQLPRLVAFFERQRDLFRKEAAYIQWQLDGGDEAGA
jgi:hypothetical protein